MVLLEYHCRYGNESEVLFNHVYVRGVRSGDNQSINSLVAQTLLYVAGAS
jgi:hypothetical protein